MKAIRFPADPQVEWLAYDEPSQILFAWLIHARYNVYGGVTPRQWRLLSGASQPGYWLNANAEPLDTTRHVYDTATEALAEMEAHGRILLRRGRFGPAFSIQRILAPGATNPEVLPAFHGDEDCERGISHSWLLTDARNEHGVTELRLFHVRHYDAAIVPPDPLVGTY